MADVQHSTLTDPELHEPKGVAAASSGEVYVADGSSSGAWGLAETIGATKDVTGTDGYVKLPGGVILQWGQISSTDDGGQTFTFPTTFSTACFSVVVQGINSNATNVYHNVTSKNTTGFVFDRNNDVSGTVTYMYQAIGY